MPRIFPSPLPRRVQYRIYHSYLPWPLAVRSSAANQTGSNTNTTWREDFFTSLSNLKLWLCRPLTPFILDSDLVALDCQWTTIGLGYAANKVYTLQMSWYSVLLHNKGELVEVAKRRRHINVCDIEIKAFQTCTSPLPMFLLPWAAHESSKQHARHFALAVLPCRLYRGLH